MPKCAACMEEMGRSSFSKAQLRKPETTRRCKVCTQNGDPPRECARTEEKVSTAAASSAQNTAQRMLRQAVRSQQQNEQERDEQGERKQQKAIQKAFRINRGPPEAIPLSENNKLTVLEGIAVAAERIMKRGLPLGVGIENRKGLTNRLWDVMNNEYTLWFTWPLLVGLASNDKREINRRVQNHRNSEALPIIHWLCQYKLHSTQHNYRGGDDMIALAIDAGANLKLKNSNGTTALSFAVKYTSKFAFDLLISSGAGVGFKDVFGNSIWKNALERPDPGIIEVILSKCKDIIPVKNEWLKMKHTDGSNKALESLPNHMVGLYSGTYVTNEDVDCSIPISWQAIGVPSNDDLGISLIRVLQGGAEFTNSFEGHDDAFSLLTHIDSLEDRLYRVQQQIDIIRLLRDVIYGRWLPNAIKEEIGELMSSDPIEKNPTCPICLTEMTSDDCPITLYCGHTFCVRCALAYGKATRLNEDEPMTGRVHIHPIDGHLMFYDLNGTDKRCPCCRRLFPGNFLTSEWNAQYRSPRMRFGIDRHEANENIKGRRGPHVLTDEQLRFECRSIGMKFRDSREKLIEDLCRIMSTDFGHIDYTDGSGTMRQLSMNDDMRIELTNTSSLLGGGEEPLFLGHPERGHVVVRIEVKGVPVMATLSHNSAFTIIPQCVVDSFGMKTKPITSNQFRTVSGGIVYVAAVVDEFKFLLDGVEVCLNSAIVLEKQEDFMLSIQLGMDFFESAAWTRSSTAFGKDMSVVFDGGHTKNTFLKDQPGELRYYSRDGKIGQVPFVYVSHISGRHNISIVSLPGDMSTNFSECQWCTRMFPSDGMVECTERQAFNRFYCDEECKSQGLYVVEHCM